MALKLSDFLHFFTKKKLIILAVILIALGTWYYASSRKSSTVKLETAEAQKQDIKELVSASGILTGKTTSNLKFKSSGKLAFINVSVGDRIEKGAVLAGLDTQDLQIALQQARNTLRDKQAIVEKNHDDIKDHDDDETFAQKQSRTTAEVAKDNAFDEVKKAQRAFQEAAILSPISGIITKTDIIPGQTVSSSDTIAQVVDETELFFDADVDEADIGKISPTQSAEITLDSYPNKIFAGIVDQILPTAKTTSSGATVVTTRIKLVSPPVNFVSGLNGQASIVIAQKANTLAIPQEALRDDNTVVIQDRSGNLEVKKVETGISSDTDIEVKSGLNEGEQVVKNPPAQVNTRRSTNPLGGVVRIFRSR